MYHHQGVWRQGIIFIVVERTMFQTWTCIARLSLRREECVRTGQRFRLAILVLAGFLPVVSSLNTHLRVFHGLCACCSCWEENHKLSRIPAPTCLLKDLQRTAVHNPPPSDLNP